MVRSRAAPDRYVPVLLNPRPRAERQPPEQDPAGPPGDPSERSLFQDRMERQRIEHPDTWLPKYTAKIDAVASANIVEKTRVHNNVYREHNRRINNARRARGEQVSRCVCANCDRPVACGGCGGTVFKKRAARAAGKKRKAATRGRQIVEN